MSTEAHTQFRFIDVRHLSLSPLNVRKTGADTGIEQLAELIAAEGILQNLDVYECDEGEGKKKTTHAVVAGGRRWRALQLLARQKRIKPDYAVPCLVVSHERAVQISLAENSGREPMHPADEFDAFRQLIDAGQSVEDVAARFGVAPVVVQRRLKLANVGPTFIALYREGEITLEHLMALAVTDDHSRQQQAWDSLQRYERHPGTLRRVLTEHEISARDPIAKFVGIKTYEKAGGIVRRDLFEEDDEGVMLDGELLRQLAAQKLEKHAAKLKEEGVAWVDVRPQWSYADRAGYGRVRASLRPPTEEEQARLSALNTRRMELDAQLEAAEEGDDERYEALSQQIEAVDAELGVFDEARSVVDPAQQACAGAVVSIGHDGKLSVEKNLLKPEDAKRLAQGHGRPTSDPQETRLHSAALVRRLTAHRTLALQAVLSERPDIALVALTHRLVLKTFSLYGFTRASVVEIDPRSAALAPHAEELASSKAHGALQSRREALEDRLPKDEQQLFAWLLQQPQSEVLALLAFCAAQSVDGVTDSETRGAFDELARAAALDMREWWTATATSYFGSVSRTRVLEAVTEALSADATTELSKLKKAALVQAAEEKVAGRGWLPSILRNAE
jgi:ParB family chromosome partitioning protein